MWWYHTIYLCERRSLGRGHSAKRHESRASHCNVISHLSKGPWQEALLETKQFLYATKYMVTVILMVTISQYNSHIISTSILFTRITTISTYFAGCALSKYQLALLHDLILKAPSFDPLTATTQIYRTHPYRLDVIYSRQVDYYCLAWLMHTIRTLTAPIYLAARNLSPLVYSSLIIIPVEDAGVGEILEA